MSFRPFGTHLPVDAGPLPPDAVQTMLLAAGTAQTFDWFSTAGTAATNAGSAGVQIICLTGQTTNNANLNFSVNLYSTGVISPTSGTSVTSGVGVSHPVNAS